MINKHTGWCGLLLLLLAVPCSGQQGVRAYYDDDFVLETTDGSFQLKIRGNFHLDTRLFQSEARGAPHSIDLRRARIDLQGRIHERFTFRLHPELAGTPYLRNAWVDVQFSPALHLRLGQMKVPFSTSWLTLDNNLNFLERGASAPTLPFFDRGALLWGELWAGTLTYNLGLFTGANADKDVPSGDTDDYKDLSARFFTQPFRTSEGHALEGLYLVAEATWGRMSTPTSRIETGGYRSANYDAALWRWRTEQILGTDGRVTDRVGALIDTRYRLGAELHYLFGPVAFSIEHLAVHYNDIVLYHDFYVGNSRAAHKELYRTDGVIRSWSVWTSFYLTGESKRLTNQGWRTAKPSSLVSAGGLGAWEILARVSKTWATHNLFTPVAVTGFESGSSSLPQAYTGATPGTGNSLVAAVADGAHDVHEVTLGLNWTINPMVRIQLNDVLLWAPASDRDGDGQSDNFIVSGAKSGQVDPDKTFRKTSWENAIMLRLVFKF